MKKFLLSTCFILCAQSAFSMEGEKEFNPFKVENFVFPQSSQTYENYVGGTQKNYAPFEIKTLEDLKKTVWYLFDALNPNEEGWARSSNTAVKIIKKINDETILAKALFVALEPNEGGWARSSNAAVECIKKINDEKILGKALFVALEPSEGGWARSSNAAVECIKKINDEKILVKALFVALEPSKWKEIRSHDTAFECIEKIEDKEILTQALFMALEPNNYGGARCEDRASECIKKINNESVTRDALVLAMKNRGDDEIRSREVVNAIFTLRQGINPIITDAELVDLYQTNRNRELRACIEHEVNAHRIHLGPQIGLNIGNITGQEALFRERQTFLQGFNKTIKDPKWNDLYPKTQKEAQEYFDSYVKTLQDFLLEAGGFKHKIAELSLRLLQGDKDVPTYYGSTPQHYRDVTRMDDSTKSTGLQLFVMLTQMCERKKEELIAIETENRIRTFITQNYGLSQTWNIFLHDQTVQNVFKEKNIELKDTLANTIDYIKGNNKEDLFYETFKDLPKYIKGIHNLLKNHTEEISKESFKNAYSSLIEILFMLQRGHNEKLNDPQEANKPRCPVGFFDDCMREITIASGYSEFAKDLQIQKCE